MPTAKLPKICCSHGEFALGKLSRTDDWHPRPTAYRPPLYPVVLSNLPAAGRQQVSLAKVAALHLLLGVATVWLTWADGEAVLCRVRSASGPAPRAPSPTCRMVGRTAASRPMFHPTIAGLLVACDPILLNQQTLVMTETLAAFLAILSLWCLARFDAAPLAGSMRRLAGGAIGLAMLCRPTFLPWLGLVGGGDAVCPRRTGFQNSEFKSQIAAGIGWRLLAGGWPTSRHFVAAAVISPWAIRNYRVFGKPIVTTTHGGYTLLLGNNPDVLRLARIDQIEPGFPGDVRHQPNLQCIRCHWRSASERS